jgi:hypothetical protein
MEFLQCLRQAVDSPSDIQQKLATTLTLFVLFYCLRFIALRALFRKVHDTKALYQWRKAITYVTVIIAFLAIGSIWFQGFASLSTFLGVLSAGLAIALQDPIVNLAGWLFIIVRRTFSATTSTLRIPQFTTTTIPSKGKRSKGPQGFVIPHHRCLAASVIVHGVYSLPRRQ